MSDPVDAIGKLYSTPASEREGNMAPAYAAAAPALLPLLVFFVQLLFRR